MTDVVYEQYARSARVRPVTVVLGHGAKGHWIGDTNSQTVLIWYHGKNMNGSSSNGLSRLLNELFQAAGSVYPLISPISSFWNIWSKHQVPLARA